MSDFEIDKLWNKIKKAINTVTRSELERWLQKKRNMLLETHNISLIQDQDNNCINERARAKQIKGIHGRTLRGRTGTREYHRNNRPENNT